MNGPSRKPKLISVVALALLAGAGGMVLFSCFSFRVTVPEDPQCVVGTLAIVHSEPAAMDFEKPIRDEPVVADDASIFALIKVLQVSQPIKLQWQWYSPDNRLARRSKAVEINAKGKYLAYFAAWDTLHRSYFSEKKGKWTVVITADGAFLAKREFTVN
ncbi:MAG: hypothetical protein JXO51_05595 [Candidatus Aminicenantes bacterium]|nr:hypothetical protein [Candidatus Aminicenantes bacterium]